DKIFEENLYASINIENDITFYNKSEVEYYFTAKYSQEEFLNFFEADKSNNIIEQFDKFKSKDSNIKKNTSLIIYLEVDNIENFYIQNKGLIFKIEEDEYFFRKYVIIYTADSIKN